MSSCFFSQLQIPEPLINLEVGSGTQAEQTASIMLGYEKILMANISDLCLVVGDVTSTMACAITAQKLCIPIAHVEAGIRSCDWTMPEEINRIVTDSITKYFFTTSELANTNLKKAGIKNKQIFFVGNTMVDTLLSNQDRLAPPNFLSQLSLTKNNFFLLTLHRPNNVDCPGKLNDLLKHISVATRGQMVIFPTHPRTEKTLTKLHNLPSNIVLVPPQPYLEFGYLLKNSKAIITDSGGVSEEATIYGIPCMTLRNNTERPETISLGTNELLGTDNANIKPAVDKVLDGKWKKGSIPKMWDGKTGMRIAQILESVL